MPAILEPVDYHRWLSDEADPRELMRPYPAELMRMWPTRERRCIDRRANRAFNRRRLEPPAAAEPHYFLRRRFFAFLGEALRESAAR
jgi:hypothetical protein